MRPLPRSFYQNPDVVAVAKQLLGKALLTPECGGIIIETEAYAGIDDRASHAYGGRRTKRTEAMYAPGGIAYVYLCYGIHHLLNVVTNVENVPHAVLIRALKPIHGIDLMKQRRGKGKLTNGPGALAAALGITLAHYGLSFDSEALQIADCGIQVREEEIVAGPRIGVDYAGVDAKLPYRFRALTVALNLPEQR